MLRVDNLTVGYKGNTLLSSLNFDQSGGELIALIGRNGSGKSTLLRTIVGLLKPYKGDVFVDGLSIVEIKSNLRAQIIAYVSTENVRVAHLRVWDVVAMGRAPYNSFTGALSEGDKNIVLEAINKVGMQDFLEINIDRLSDGERQRVMIARALAQQSKMIILDEPTAFLDLPNRLHIMKLLKELAREGKLIILSTHELNLAAEVADKLWVVHNNELIRGDVNDINVKNALDSMMK